MARKALTQLDLNSNRIINVGAPSLGTDATTKTYVDGKEVPLTFNSPLVRTGNAVDFVPSIDCNFSTSQSFTLTDVSTTTMVTVLSLGHNSSGGAGAIGLGPGLAFEAESSTTVDQLQGRIHARWTDATHATRSAKMTFTNVLNGIESDALVLFPSGGAAFNGAADPLANCVGLPTGGTFKINGLAANLPTGGTVGQSLIKQSSTNFDTAWKSFASAQVSGQANPTGTTSTVGVMMGMGGATLGPFVFTPTSSGKALLMVHGTFYNNTANATHAVSLRYGTGTAPANGAALTGTAGPTHVRANAPANSSTDFTLALVVTGLAVGTQIWVDITLQSGVNTQTTNATGIFFSAVELP